MAGVNSVRGNFSTQHSQSTEKTKNKSDGQAERNETSLLKRKDTKDQLDLSTSRLNMNDDAISYEQSEPAAENTNNNNDESSSCGKGGGKNKSGKALPPGIAKKQAADLPDGNPWKAALEEKEAQASQQNSKSDSAAAADQSASTKNPVAEMLKNFLEMILAALASETPDEAEPEAQ